MHGRGEHRHRVPLRHKERFAACLLFCTLVEFGEHALPPRLINFGTEKQVLHRGRKPDFILRRIFCDTHHRKGVLHGKGIAEGVAWVMMGGEKIAGNSVFLAECLEVFEPQTGGGRRPAYTQVFIHLLDGARRRLIQAEIVLLLPLEEDGKVGLVPDFEVPALHFLLAVAAEKKLYKRRHKLAPARKRLGLRDIIEVTNTGLFAARQSRGHKG